jgi:hypothetical protein
MFKYSKKSRKRLENGLFNKKTIAYEWNYFLGYPIKT